MVNTALLDAACGISELIGCFAPPNFLTTYSIVEFITI